MLEHFLKRLAGTGKSSKMLTIDEHPKPEDDPQPLQQCAADTSVNATTTRTASGIIASGGKRRRLLLRRALIDDLLSVLEWRGPIYCLIFFGVIFATGLWLMDSVQKYLTKRDAVENIALLLAYAFLIIAITLVVTFFVVFKGIPADKARLNHVITYCYAFVMFSLFGSVLPFLFLPHVPKLPQLMQVTPLGIVRGCSDAAADVKSHAIPLELQCGKHSAQWVVNLGGVVFQGPWIPRSPDTPTMTASGAVAADAAPVTDAAGRLGPGGSMTVVGAAMGAARMPVVMGAAASAVDGTARLPNSPAAATPADAVMFATSASPPVNASDATLGAATVPAPPGHAAAPFQGSTTNFAQVSDIQVIQGGLVIPLYVVVLSLMGASVSMTRRVPEYQRRMSPGDPNFMSYDEAREALVFQVMQVFSAPFIAVTMYYLIDPSSRASTIVLAFASGFSSETILLTIRAFLEKIKPVHTTVPRAATNVSISPARLDFGKVAVGSTSISKIAIVNPTAVTLEVMSINCTGTGDFSTVARFPMNIHPGKSESVDVTFSPRLPGTKSGVLVVTDNSAGSPRAIDIFGEGISAGSAVG